MLEINIFTLSMYDLVPLLSTVLPIIASSLLIFVLSINLYQKIRRKFPVSVNCWFCNAWTKVTYDERNCFDCPSCSQYNGFTKDGDYNKIIPEQHDEFMNKSGRIKSNKTLVSNGLCTLCNNNQNLKVIQLANFVPMVEENYDNEVEHFQKQLEKAYKLCKKCDKTLKFTIEKQNAWIFGKHVKNICTNGFSTLHHLSKNLKSYRQSKFFKSIEYASIILISAVLLLILLNNKFTAKYLPKGVLSNINSFTNTAAVTFNSPKIKICYYSLLCCFGFVIQTVSVLIGQYAFTIKMNRLLCWTILLLLSGIKLSRSYAIYISAIQVFCCLYLLYSSFVVNKSRKLKHRSVKKINSSLQSSCSEFSEVSQFDDISSSSKKHSGSLSSNTSQCSSDYLNKSTCCSQKSEFYTNQVPINIKNNLNTASSVLNSSFASSYATANKSDKHNNLDLNQSLNNLHLDHLNSPRTISPVFSVSSMSIKRPKPVLSPARFQGFNQNSWVAGNYWKNIDINNSQRGNLSRSSSESSGIGSQNNDFVNPFKSPSPSLNNYSFMPVVNHGQDFRARGNIYYPDLQQSMGFIRGGPSPNFQLLLGRENELFQRRSFFNNEWPETRRDPNLMDSSFSQH